MDIVSDRILRTYPFREDFQGFFRFRQSADCEGFSEYVLVLTNRIDGFLESSLSMINYTCPRILKVSKCVIDYCPEIKSDMCPHEILDALAIAIKEIRPDYPAWVKDMFINIEACLKLEISQSTIAVLGREPTPDTQQSGRYAEALSALLAVGAKRNAVAGAACTIIDSGVCSADVFRNVSAIAAGQAATSGVKIACTALYQNR